MAKSIDKREKLAREMTRRNFATTDDRLSAFDEAVSAPSIDDIRKAIAVGTGRMGRETAYGEKPLAGGLDIAEVGGIPINATDLIGTGIPSKLALSAKAFAPALAAALGGTAIASKASQGAKLNALSNVLRKERGIFAGVNAKTADLEALARAKEMQSAGVPDREIHAQTGWTLGFPDEKPRFEIDDTGAISQYTHLPESGNERIAQRAIDHPDLFEAYPDMRNITQLGLRDSKDSGSLDSLGWFLTAKAPTIDSLKSTGLHELQHATQQREGFARGGSPEIMGDILQERKIAASQQLNELRRAGEIEPDKYELLMSKINSIPDKIGSDQMYEGYRRLAGEAEARLTQARMNMNPQQRAASYPLDMFDVAPEDQIVRY